MTKSLPFSEEAIRAVCEKFPTPVYLYDEQGIRENARALQNAFSWAPKFKNYFAVKATPTPAILSLVRDEGMGLDCSSFVELLMAEKVGVTGEDIMFTSNETPAKDMRKAFELGAIINLDDISHVDFLDELCGLKNIRGGLICMRYNPGPLKKGNVIIGKPEEAKYGLTREQIFEGYERAKKLGARRFALHTMVASNELDERYFVETAEMLFTLAVDIKQKLGIAVEFINLGGGIGVAYKLDQKPVHYQTLSEGIRAAYERIIVPAGLGGLEIKMENGRVITGPYGYLVSTVLHLKHIYKDYVGLDACMANLMRPGMYGAYHHITVLGKSGEKQDHVYDVVGGLCENNDKFAIDRALPEIRRGDIVIIHDAGAHGHAMGFNYNGKLRSAEVLVRADGSARLIRREQTAEDYFAPMVWDA